MKNLEKSKVPANPYWWPVPDEYKRAYSLEELADWIGEPIQLELWADAPGEEDEG